MKSLALTLAATALTASSAWADTRVATVRVPFAFMAGSNEMPAGEYSISKSEQRILFLRTSGKTVALLPVGSTAPASGHTNAVRFERVGGRNVLSEVLVDGGEGFLLRH
jgi:hypothetical protein